MKSVIVLGDGMGDYPIKELGGKTPLEAARTPRITALAREGEVGVCRTTPEGFYPGSDVTQMGLLGYDPKRYYTGRAPLEAAGLGVALGKDDVAYRCNLVTLRGKAAYDVRRLNASVILEDFAGGHIGTDEAKELLLDLNDQLGSETLQFSHGVSYRHLMVWAGGQTRPTCTPPHDVTGQAIGAYLPKGEGAETLREVMEASLKVLQAHPVNKERLKDSRRPANGIWLWGQGKAPQLPTFADRYKRTGSMITAVDLLRGLGVYAGLEIIRVPGATGYLDTNYRGKADYGLAALAKRDFLYLHVEAPDEAGHNGDLTAKIEAIEAIDTHVIGPLVDGLAKLGDYRLLFLCDHWTPIVKKTHTPEPVPFLLYDRAKPARSGRAYTEAEAQASGVRFETAPTLLDHLLRG